MVRIPVPLKARLDALCEKELEAYQSGKVSDLPESSLERNRVPIYHVIEKALDHLEKKRKRSATKSSHGRAVVHTSNE